MICAVWKPTPRPGTMALCASGCPHARPAAACALARPDRVPPLTEIRRGKEHCGFWPPPKGDDPAQPELFQEALAAS